MEGSLTVSFSSPKVNLPFKLFQSSASSRTQPLSSNLRQKPVKLTTLSPNIRNFVQQTRILSVTEALQQAVDTSDCSYTASNYADTGNVVHKIDKSGRFCSPRAARELALLIAYAACLEGSDPVRLFDKRANAKRERGYVFDKASLLKYNHMSFGGAPVEVGTEEEAEELMHQNEKDSANEAEVLSAPLKLVYNRYVLHLARNILRAVVDKWNQHVLVIDKIIPPNWKNEPAARILELCILHLAMAEISVVGTRHPIVINEAIDLSKRFCDGCAPRIINGCLRTFVKDYREKELQPSEL